MTQEKKNGKIIAIITMIFLFGMISFVTGLQNPMGIIVKSQFGASNLMATLGYAANFIAYAFMGIPAGILLQRIGYKKTALAAIIVGFIGVGIQYVSGIAGSFVIYLIIDVSGYDQSQLNLRMPVPEKGTSLIRKQVFMAYIYRKSKRSVVF